MPQTMLNINDVWHPAKQVFINQGGAWRNCREIWTRRNGVWRKIFRRSVQILIDADTQNLDLFTLAGSPSGGPIELDLVIGLDVIVSSADTATAAIYSSADFPPGSFLNIENRGQIVGAGGNGGDWTPGTAGGGTELGLFNPGLPGGNALELPTNAVINNLSGIIAGGGGGGAGGVTEYGFSTIENGPNGGGGAGRIPGLKGYHPDWGGNVPATDGTFTEGGSWCEYQGLGVFSGAGGDLGQDGGTVVTYSGTSPGGAAGRAVERNNFSLTFASGETAAQIKGAYD